MKYLVAINFHEFHDSAFLQECCESVLSSVEEFEKTGPEQVSIVVFDSSSAGHCVEIQQFLSTSDIQTEYLNITGNGPTLNHQLEYAKRHGYDVFFRVDGDDLVLEGRFARQAQILQDDDGIDVCGGGLEYTNQVSNKSHVVMPSRSPNTLDYLTNRYCLHPTFAIRVASLPDNLRYWDKRIEDKKFILDAKLAGLKFVNDQHVHGIYNYHPKSRSSWSAIATTFKLNARWALSFKPIALAPAIVFLLASVVLPTDTLRSIRNGIFRS